MLTVAEGALNCWAVVGKAEERLPANDNDRHDQHSIALEHLMTDRGIAGVELSVGNAAGVEKPLERPAVG